MKIAPVLFIALFVLTGLPPQTVRGSERSNDGYNPPKNELSVEGKFGTEAKHENIPVGFGGRISFIFIGKDTRWGIESSVQVIPGWEDTLDILNSPEPGDTALYDIWTKSGTDVFFLFGPFLRRRVLGDEASSLSADFGIGAAVIVSAYDEIKEAADPPPRDIVSVNPVETAFYIKPRLNLSVGRFYIAYEYIAIMKELEHTFSLGVTF